MSQIGENHSHEDEEDEEEEALSLRDLPVTSTTTQEVETGDVDYQRGKDFDSDSNSNSDSDFDFGSLIGSITAWETEMCAADEVFSGGRILPFRHSVSSEVGRSSRVRVPTTRSISRLDSMDRVASKAGNHFHSHSYPSPKPQIRGSGARPINCGATKTTMWQVLRLGLVRTPEMELQDLKVRRRTSSHNNNINNNLNNRSSGSDSVSRSSSSSSSDSTTKKQRDYKNRGGILGSCNCSVSAIEPIIMAPRMRGTDRNRKFELLLNEDKVLGQKKEEDGNRGRQGKRVTSHYRTFQWLLTDISQTRV